jgi:hypothetical protein
MKNEIKSKSRGERKEVPRPLGRVLMRVLLDRVRFDILNLEGNV